MTVHDHSWEPDESFEDDRDLEGFWTDIEKVHDITKDQIRTLRIGFTVEPSESYVGEWEILPELEFPQLHLLCFADFRKRQAVKATGLNLPRGGPRAVSRAPAHRKAHGSEKEPIGVDVKEESDEEDE